MSLKTRMKKLEDALKPRGKGRTIRILVPWNIPAGQQIVIDRYKALGYNVIVMVPWKPRADVNTA